MDTHYREIKPILAPGVTLATLGVLMTTIITGLFIYSLSDLLPGNFQFVEPIKSSVGNHSQDEDDKSL
jgi:NhaP-type Na+/H+ or K+/H+ antiporter